MDDISAAEKDGTNLRQRYIEWQAEINLLQKRTITGTAAGCINDHRSKFYYHLPKLNTLTAFDRNGWLLIAAETGILGLVCFCWSVIHYIRTAFGQIKRNKRCAGANLVGLVSICVANLFSSVLYNGVLIVFVLVTALVSSTNRIFEEVEK